MIKFVLYVYMISVTVYKGDALFEWLFGNDGNSEKNDKIVRTSGMKFEVSTGDQRFLQLKDVLDNMSPLDACYNIVVFKLKKKCGELTEEELGKVSVQLLNCQSSVEERTIYPCNEQMTIADCTKDMDSTTWNSYQIVSNRARALCYATQQQQFRHLTELTVNQLVSTAHGQLEYMKELQAGQEQLHLLTTDTVRKLYESQNELISHQLTIRQSQDNVINNIHNSMEELTKEKAMIATGNTELAKLTQNIREKLDEATEQLKKQEDLQLESHGKIIEDLTNIQNKSHDALKKLDESSKYLMKNHKEMLGHYGLMYENMMKINKTVSHLLTTVNSMQEHLDERINWFSHLLNVADDKLSMITCGACHLGYFLFAALAASFLGIPSFSRVTLLLIVTINAVMETQSGHSLDFISISVFMLITCTVNWVYVWWSSKYPQSSSSPPPVNIAGSLSDTGQTTTEDEIGEPADEANTVPPLSPVEIRQLTTTLGRLYTSLNQSIHTDTGQTARVDSSMDNAVPSTSAFSPVIRSMRAEQVRPDSSTMQDDVTKVRRYLEDLEERSSVSSYSPNSHNSTPRNRPSSRASTSTIRSLCQGFTKSGTPCRLSSSATSPFCHRHVKTAAS